MNVSDRDKKILMGIIPLVLIGAFWFLLLGPKRSEATKVSEQLTSAQQKRDASVQKAGVLMDSRDSYAQDYETVVRLGKAVPSTLDMPSLLVQLDSASKGTKIKFTSVKAGERQTATAPTSGAASGSTSSSSSSSATPASGTQSSGGSSSDTPASAAGGAPAQTGAGQAAEKANNASATSDQANANAGAAPADGSSASTGSATPSTSSGASASGATSGTSAPGLDSVPLDFAFKGSFFDLADFFHEMKRFVRTANGKIAVRGRLMTINSLDFKPSSEGFPHIVATVNATVFLSPKSEGTTAGGTPSGPTATPTGSTATPTGSTGTGTSGGASGAPIPSSSPGGTAQ